MTKKILLLPPFFTFAHASTLDEVAGYLNDAYSQLFDMIHAWRWIFAVLPAAIVFWALYTAHKHISLDLSGSPGSMGASRGTGIHNLGIYLKYVLSGLIGIYLIYGVFGVVYAGASDFSEVWNKLVEKFWISLF